MSPGLHICQIKPRGSDNRGEWVQVANDATSPTVITGLELTDYTATQQHVHVIKFLAANDGAPLSLSNDESAFVFTGHGTSRWHQKANGRWELHLFAGRSAPVWNNTGDVAYLRKPNGQFIDTMTVGDPARHPNGH